MSGLPIPGSTVESVPEIQKSLIFNFPAPSTCLCRRLPPFI